MTINEQEKAFVKEVWRVIERFQSEFDLTGCNINGLLAFIQNDMNDQLGDDIEEEEDGE